MDRDLVFLTISFDPRYDTPEVLARYAASQRAGGPGWHFLTGDPAKIERVCNAFGIQYWAEEGLITHSLQTAVIDRDGRLAATVEGKDFTPPQLGDLVGAGARSLDRAGQPGRCRRRLTVRMDSPCGGRSAMRFGSSGRRPSSPPRPS